MPFFRCVIVSFTGKRGVRILEAEDLQAVKEKLLKEQTAPLEIRQLRKGKISFSSLEALQFTQETARLLRAGLPLYEALGTLAEKYRGQKMEPLLVSLGTQIEKGRPFSEALRQFPSVFSLLYRSMVAHAEKTGRIQQALEEIGELLSREKKIRKQLVSALAYPALLFSFCFVVLGALFFYVVPSLEELFSGRVLPPMTAVVFSLSHFFRSSQKLLLASAALFLLALAAARFHPPFKEWARHRALRVWGIKTFWTKVSLARFCRAVAALLDGGLPLALALAEARGLLSHPELEKVALDAENRLMQGGKIAAAFQNHPLIPPLVPRMLALAEQSGKLSFSFSQIAGIYEEDAEAALLRFASLIQPILLLFLGGLIGFVLLAVLMPLTDVSGF